MAENEAFPLDEAEIVALFVESIFYGIYLVSFGACIRALFSGAGIYSSLNKAMLVVAILMAIFGTLDLALGLRHALQAFIWYHGPGGAIAEFEKVSSWIQVTRNGSYIAQILTGDLILISRCFIVYNRGWLIIAFPIIMWTGTLVSGCAVVYISSHLGASPNLTEKHLVPFLTSLLVLTMAQTFVTTTLIAYRILSTDRRMSQFRSNPRQSRLKPVVTLIIESGAIYTVTMFICLIVYLCSSNAQYPVSDASIMIIGIVFNMIIVRVHQGNSEPEAAIASGVHSSGRPITFGTSLTSRGTFSNGHPLSPFGSSQKGGHATQRVEVSVSRQVVKDIDDDSDSVYVESTTNTEAMAH